jgi:hypothetical protein
MAQTDAPRFEPDRTRVETPDTLATDGGRQFRGLRFTLGVALAVMVTVILTAIDVQSGRILDREGHGWSFRVLFGPDVFSGTNLQGWRVVSETGQLTNPARYASLLRAFLVVDFAFITVYFFLLREVITTIGRGLWRRLGMAALLGLVFFDVVEKVLSVPGLLDQPGPVVIVATGLKWGALLLIVAILALGAATSLQSQPDRRVRARLKRGGKAVMHQRFSFVPVVALSVLSVPSGAAILEQLPDALRGWISQGTVGARQAVLSMLSTLGLGAFLIMAGRYRTGYAFRHPKPAPPPPCPQDPEPEAHLRDQPQLRDQGPKADLRVWAVGPLVALAGALLVMFTGHGGDILWGRLALFLAVPLVVIVGGSLIIRKVWERPGNEGLYRPD